MTPTLSLLTLLAASTAGAASASSQRRSTADCDAVHLFLARGNNEPYPGRQAALVEAICDGVASCGYEDLIYSALYTDLSCQTAYDGVLAAYDQLSAYACRCPNAKLILLGYSQGAQIATDFLGGGGGTLFNGCIQPETPALVRNTALGKRLNAIIAFGDTHHTANQPYNYGAGSGFDGIFPRPEKQLQALDQWRSVLWSYCGPNDPVCASSGPKAEYNVTEHLGYYNNTVLLGQAAAWAKDVADIKDDSSFTTTIPISLSGTAQDYATIPTTFVPGGTVQTHALVTSSCAASSQSSKFTTDASSSTSTASESSRNTDRVLSPTTSSLASPSSPAASESKESATITPTTDSAGLSHTSLQPHTTSTTATGAGASGSTFISLKVLSMLAVAVVVTAL
ncbi:hypothetical protein NLU13_7163 [Sarocladium strictum]|uniref:Cutinase n=1 Tax=Sarocladium strictum TaxID=5046 RepID=A0AA39GCA6_SARSR|nr:hypothetical protein NLU13_7163 [Sarocladium strictum]